MESKTREAVRTLRETEGLSLRAIAVRLNLSKGSIYHHFQHLGYAKSPAKKKQNRSGIDTPEKAARRELVDKTQEARSHLPPYVKGYIVEYKVIAELWSLVFWWLSQFIHIPALT